MSRILLTCFLLMLVPPLQAQVYKCPGPGGTVIFSDRECAEDAEVVENLDSGSSGISNAPGGPPSSLTLGDGSILAFKEIISIEVKTEAGYRTGKEGMHVPYGGTDRLVEFENLESLQVFNWDRDPCGNTAHLCRPMVSVKTRERETTVQYEALRNIKIRVNDELDGVEKEMTVWFGVDNRPHIRSIRF